MINQLTIEDFLYPKPPDTRTWDLDITFNLTLSDGSIIQARFHYLTKNLPHFQYHGEAISSTGYRSHFFGYGIWIPEEEIESLALSEAELIRAEHLKEINKQKKRKKS
jgi:hypothetical protein